MTGKTVTHFQENSFNRNETPDPRDPARKGNMYSLVTITSDNKGTDLSVDLTSNQMNEVVKLIESWKGQLRKTSAACGHVATMLDPVDGQSCPRCEYVISQNEVITSIVKADCGHSQVVKTPRRNQEMNCNITKHNICRSCQKSELRTRLVRTLTMVKAA